MSAHAAAERRVAVRGSRPAPSSRATARSAPTSARRALGRRPSSTSGTVAARLIVDGRVGEVAQQLGVALRGARGGLAHLGEVEVGPHAGDQLARGERLDEVVVGARGEPLDGGLLPGAGGEHDHRQLRGRRVRAQRGEQPEAVELGHHRVGEDQVGPARRDRLQRGAAVAHGLDVPVAGQQPLEVVAQVGVVVGDQDPRPRRRRAASAGTPAPTASSSPTESSASGSQRSASSR